MKKIRNIGLIAIIGLLITSCGSSPEEQIKDAYKKAYEDGKIDREENRELKDLVRSLRESTGERLPLVEMRHDVRLEVYTKEMVECIEGLEDVNLEDLHKGKGGCENILKKIMKDFEGWEKDKAADFIMEVNEAVYNQLK